MDTVTAKSLFTCDTRLTETEKETLELIRDEQSQFFAYGKFITAWYARQLEKIYDEYRKSSADVYVVFLCMTPLLTLLLFAITDGYLSLFLGGCFEFILFLLLAADHARTNQLKKFIAVLEQCYDNAELVLTGELKNI